MVFTWSYSMSQELQCVLREGICDVHVATGLGNQVKVHCKIVMLQKCKDNWHTTTHNDNCVSLNLLQQFMSVTVRCPNSFAHIVYGPYNLPDFNNLPVYVGMSWNEETRDYEKD